MPDLTPADELRAAAVRLGDPTSVTPDSMRVELLIWLKGVAELHEQNTLPGHANVIPPGCQWCNDEDWPCNDMRHALATARAVLAATES
jgi:hypothetical protein